MHYYFIFLTSDDPTFCVIKKLPESLDEKRWRIPKGLRMDHRYPSGVRLQMGSGFSGIVVPDMIENLVNYCLVSQKLKDLLESEVKTEIEFLPFMLYNHKGRVARDDCYIVNVIGTEDCVDLSRTEAREDPSVRGTFMSLRKLYLDDSRINPRAKLFRIQQMPKVMIIRDDLRKVLKEHNMTGIKYVEMGESCRLL